MKILDNSITADFDKKIKSVKYNFLDKSNKFYVEAISVFDHCLSVEEAEEIIFFYDQAITSQDKDKVTQYFLHENMFVNFYNKLFEYTSVYGVLFSEDNYYCYMNFDNIEEYRSYALMSIREKLFFKFILPDYYIIIGGGHDLTHVMYSLKSEKDKFENIKSFVQANNLYIL